MHAYVRFHQLIVSLSYSEDFSYLMFARTTFVVCLESQGDVTSRPSSIAFDDTHSIAAAAPDDTH